MGSTNWSDGVDRRGRLVRAMGSREARQAWTEGLFTTSGLTHALGTALWVFLLVSVYCVTR